MSSRIVFILILLSISSCTKKEYSQNECEELSMKKFKGYQRESHLFDKNCQKYTIHYSKKRCQKALKDMILGKSLFAIKKENGQMIENCFTQNDLEKFSN